MAMNVGMLATYDQVKEVYSSQFGPSFEVNVLSSVTAGLVAATVTLPFDLTKTRIQKMKPLADGTMPYK